MLDDVPFIDLQIYIAITNVFINYPSINGLLDKRVFFIKVTAPRGYSCATKLCPTAITQPSPFNSTWKSIQTLVSSQDCGT